MGTGWGSNQFTPMLLVYSHSLGLSTGTLEALFGAYALGLIPGLLIAGPLSDAVGRRPVVIPAAALSLLASVTLVAGAHTVALLFAGRLLAGVSSGAVFGAGTAWLREASLPPVGDAGPATAARRAAVAMTIGFAFGPLVSGLVAQWAPQPRLTAYLPHIALMVAVLAAAAIAPETVAATPGRRLRLSVPGVRHPRFRRHVGPMAPWVFAAPAVAFALLPSVVGANHATDGVALTAAITALVALAGVLIQPFARRLEAVARGANAGTVGLFVACAGLLLSAGAAQAGQIWMLVPCGLVLGAAYGLILVAGLLEVQRLAAGRRPGGPDSRVLRADVPGVCGPVPAGAGVARGRVSAAADDHRGACGGDRGARSPQRARAARWPHPSPVRRCPAAAWRPRPSCAPDERATSRQGSRPRRRTRVQAHLALRTGR